jgi:hypothetical protein
MNMALDTEIVCTWHGHGDNKQTGKVHLPHLHQQPHYWLATKKSLLPVEKVMRTAHSLIDSNIKATSGLD